MHSTPLNTTESTQRITLHNTTTHHITMYNNRRRYMFFITTPSSNSLAALHLFFLLFNFISFPPPSPFLVQQTLQADSGGIMNSRRIRPSSTDPYNSLSSPFPNPSSPTSTLRPSSSTSSRKPVVPCESCGEGARRPAVVYLQCSLLCPSLLRFCPSHFCLPLNILHLFLLMYII